MCISPCFFNGIEILYTYLILISPSYFYVGMRSRSGSIVSTPGSFHGDGSDPSDTGHGTPLTAEELSDLIVGRSPKPCRGKYPSVATVSETLDSVADYVTLPPPPAPPPPRMSFKLTEPLVSHCNNTIALHNTFSSRSSESSSSYVARHGSMSNESHNSTGSKYCSEEAMLQRQIQFQHLAAGFSSHLLMDALPNSHPAALAMKPPTMCLSTSDLSQLNEATFAAAASQLTKCQQLQQQQLHQQRLQHHKSCTSIPLHIEEANARVITTKPHINVLRAQSTYVPSGSLMPSYSSAVTPLNGVASSPPNSSSCYVQSQQTPPLPPLPQPVHMSAALLSKFGKISLQAAADSVPVVGANNYLDVRKSGAAFLQQFHEKFPPPPPLLYQRQPPPPPPPPPVRNHYSGCGNAPPPAHLLHYYPHHHHHQQFDQYRQQLYSDVDYVVYPLKDPAISKQEYLDSKEASGHCALATQQHHQQQYLSQSSLNAAKMAAMGGLRNVNGGVPAAGPSLRSLYGRKTRAMYQSTPNVAMAGYVAAGSSTNSSMVSPLYQQYANAATRYASNQNLTSELSGCSNSSLMYLSSKYPSSTSPLFSTTASLYSSMQSLRQDAASASSSSMYGRILPTLSSYSFARTRSDDNILNCVDQQQQQQRISNLTNCADMKFRKPPPPPPPPYDTQVLGFSILFCL